MTTDQQPDKPEAHCKRCTYHKHVWSPQPGVSWDRCTKDGKDVDGDYRSCIGKNRDNDCADYRRTLNPLRRWHPRGEWWCKHL